MRRVLPWVALVVLVAATAWMLGQGAVRLPLFDFVQYWAAGRLNAEGRNPYDPENIRELERAVGREDAEVLMWNPPWVLPLVMPFGPLDPHTAQLLWLLMQLAAIVLSADLLWRYYGGSAEKRWIAWLIAFTSLPSYLALTAGQISPLVLLGAVLFLHAERARRFALAGQATLLLAIKPHLVLLFWVALLLHSLRERRWALLASGAAAGIAATLIAMATNPDVLGQYWQTLTTRPPAQYDSPTLGMALRLAFDREEFRLQFIPPVAGLVWLAFHWARHRRNWQWGEQLPLVILVSLLTAAYGAWAFDLVLLLVPAIAVAVAPRRPRLALALHVAINVIALVQIIQAVAYFWFVWMTPATLAAYLACRPRPLIAASPPPSATPQAAL
jgi:hypothetical protein